MKKVLVAVALAASLMLAGTGTVFAGEAKAPELGDWEYWEAVESGTLPSPQGEHGIGSGKTSGESRFPVVELGGVEYRVGLDTN